MQSKKPSLFKQSLQSVSSSENQVVENKSVLWLCGNCSNTQTFGKNDLIKCKSCNHRIFLKERNKDFPAKYVAI